MSKVKALYHIVFCTKKREMTLPLAHLEDLYRFIWNELRLLNCQLIRIGGIQNHVHLLIDLHPSVALSNAIRIIKSRSSSWMHSDPRFCYFSEWAAEYFACSISPDCANAVVEYIKRQKEHHLLQPFDKEIAVLYHDAKLELHPKDMI